VERNKNKQTRGKLGDVLNPGPHGADNGWESEISYGKQRGLTVDNSKEWWGRKGNAPWREVCDKGERCQALIVL